MTQEPKIKKRYFYSHNINDSYPRCELLTTNFDNIPDPLIGETIYIDGKYYSVRNIIKARYTINYILTNDKHFRLVIQ